MDKENNVDAKLGQNCVTAARKQVGEMNSETLQLTHYDVANISTFFIYILKMSVNIALILKQ